MTRVLVIDNASTDGSERAALDHAHVELLRMERNLGFAEANNLGVLRLDDCEWIALLNPDAFAEPRWLEALMAAAASCSDDVASFASCQKLADTPPRRGSRSTPSPVPATMRSRSSPPTLESW